VGAWAWDVSARFYRRTYGPLAHGLDDALFARLGHVRGATVADVGCGPGVVTRKFLDRGAACVYAVDVSRAMLDQVVEDPRVIPVLARLEDDPLPGLAAEAEGFDVVLFKRSLYLPRPGAIRTLRAARRALRPGGALCVIHPEASLLTYAFGKPRRIRRHTPYHLFNRGVSTLGVLAGGEDYAVYTRDALAALVEEAVPGGRIEVHGGLDAAFNMVILRDLPA
jgi:SAM-dependent methyltransferase